MKALDLRQVYRITMLMWISPYHHGTPAHYILRTVLYAVDNQLHGVSEVRRYLDNR